MTQDEARLLMGQLQIVFPIVRLVDASLARQFTLLPDGTLRPEPYHCYDVWKKQRRCDNCISARALARKGRMAKFEFVDDAVYYVVAMYLEMDAAPYVLEMASQVTDDTLLEAYGKNRFLQDIAAYNRRLYIDPLTGAYNRRYYEEQLQDLSSLSALAFLDLDGLKAVNDTWGHPAGDAALKAAADAILGCIRGTDALIRYGGDEFLLVFWDMPRKAFAAKLEQIRSAVAGARTAVYPQLALTVSIGALYRSGTPLELIGEADRLLYQAKRSRNHVCLRLDP